MSNKLREAAQAALSAMDYMLRNGEWYCAEERANALRAALAEPAIKESLTVAEQKPMLEINPQKREWVGLTDEEAAACWSTSAVKTWKAFESKLKDKNGG